GRSCGPATTDPSTGSANSSSMASPSTSHDATTVKTVSPGKSPASTPSRTFTRSNPPTSTDGLGCVKKCEQSLVFFCVVTLPEGQRRLGVYPRPVPGCGNRVQSGVAFG